MMVVLTIRSCPQKLRGDLTKWFVEIDSGVFVGNLTARVRDAVWNRVCENVRNGSAAMAYSTQNEQKLDFKIHNTVWTPIDYDGIKLIKRVYKSSNEKPKEQPKAVVDHIRKLSQRKAVPKIKAESYVVIDIETTGLDDEDEIIEIGGLFVKGGNVIRKMSVLVCCEKSLPKQITELTGITEGILKEQGIPLKQAMHEFLEFCGENTLVGHNISFDMRFLQKACCELGLPQIANETKDTMKLAKKKTNLHNFSLANVASYFGIGTQALHRVDSDCELTYRIFEKLNEK